MTTNKQKLSKNIRKKPGEVTKQHQFSFTDAEFENLKKQTEYYGFRKPSSYIRELSKYKTLDDAIEQMENNKFSCDLRPIKTIINKIHSNIDLESSIKELLKEVEKLCQEWM